METGKAIKDFSTYRIYSDGTIRNIHNRELKPDRKGCVSVLESNRRKTLSIARLVAISFLGMPDDKQHIAYKKDPNGGWEVSNIAWDSIANLNKERLTKARENNTKEIKQELIESTKQELKQSMEHLQFQHTLLVEEVSYIKQAMIEYNKQVKALERKIAIQ